MSTPRPPISLASVKEEFRTSRILRYGVFAMAGVLWLYGVLVLRDAVVAKREAWLSTEAKIVRARAVAASGDWTARGAEVKAALADYEMLLWKDGSVGLSQAAAQETASRTLASAGLTVRSIRATVSDAALSNDLPDVLPIRIQASFDFRQPAVYNWLAAMARDRAAKKPAIAVESLTVRGTTSPVVDVVLVAYTVKPGAAK